MSEELRPCPFCGGTKICTEKGINLNYCDNCSAESNVEHWNTRPIEDALQARAERAEEMVEWLIEAIGGYFYGVEHPASIWRKKISDLVTDWKEREE